MVKKYTLHLDALIIICLLFLASVFANIYLIKINSNTGKELINLKSKLLLSQLNLSSRDKELAVCKKQLDVNAK